MRLRFIYQFTYVQYCIKYFEHVYLLFLLSISAFEEWFQRFATESNKKMISLKTETARQSHEFVMLKLDNTEKEKEIETLRTKMYNHWTTQGKVLLRTFLYLYTRKWVGCQQSTSAELYKEIDWITGFLPANSGQSGLTLQLKQLLQL